jgi:predicted TIM-barrel fold metal-dependent hydrolase
VGVRSGIPEAAGIYRHLLDAGLRDEESLGHWEVDVKPVMIVSSDSHVSPPMADFRPYLDEPYREDFDAFLVEYQKVGSRNFDAPALRHRLDEEEVEAWVTNMVETGRLEGARDPKARLEQLAVEGIAGEVLFPDFGRPFEMFGSPIQASFLRKEPAPDQLDAGNRAYNRWLADFVRNSTERSVAMAPTMNWFDVEQTLTDLTWFKEVGFKGVVLPKFDPEWPLYHEHYQPIWSALEDLELIVNSHGAMSSTSNTVVRTPGAPHPGCAARMFSPVATFFTHNILAHLVWGGVLERHPRLTVVFTEQGSGWTIGYLEDMDYAYEGSYLRRDLRDVIKHKPSDYFKRQCYLGSSTFSRAEVAARHQIGLDKMMIGMDYPHHEGTFGGGTNAYLRATLGAERVPEDEARLMLGETAAAVFGFDRAAITAAAEAIGPLPEEILTPPERDLFPRGDVHKPLSGGFS